jgi:hypothetical protein
MNGIKLPDALAAGSESTAIDYLTMYYGPATNGLPPFTGSVFDGWATGSASEDPDVFTAEDVLSVGLLSVTVPAPAYILLLGSRSDQFSELLRALGPDRDLVDEPGPLQDDWIGWTVMGALRSLPGVGPTTASKLLARKRPHLRPIFDTVVAELTGTTESLWEPMRVALRADDRSLHKQLVDLRMAAGLSDAISPLRIFDVIAWMEGKEKGLGSRR